MSQKSVAQKLLIKENYKVVLLNEPEDYRSTLGDLPPEIDILTKLSDNVDFIQIFLTSKKELEAQLEKASKHLSPKGLLWVSYPKGTSKVETDVNRDIIWKYARSIGLDAVSMISVDDTWSAMRIKL